MIFTKANYRYQDWGHSFTPLDECNEQKLGTTEIINHSPQLLKDIQRARESLKGGKIYDDKDLFGKRKE